MTTDVLLEHARLSVGFYVDLMKVHFIQLPSYPTFGSHWSAASSWGQPAFHFPSQPVIVSHTTASTWKNPSVSTRITATCVYATPVPGSIGTGTICTPDINNLLVLSAMLDDAVGTPVANRMQTELAPLIGFFLKWS